MRRALFLVMPAVLVGLLAFVAPERLLAQRVSYGPGTAGGAPPFTGMNKNGDNATLPTALYNLGFALPTNLDHWKSKLAEVQAGTGSARVLWIGDSTTAGNGGGTSGDHLQNGAYAGAFPQQLIPLLNATATTYNKSIFGDQTVTSYVPYPDYDTRVAFGAGWDNSGLSLGGAKFVFTSGGGASDLTFTPAGDIDTITVWWSRTGGNGTGSVSVDGGASLGTIGTCTCYVTSSTFTVAKGPHTIHVHANNDGDLWVNGIIAKDSTTPSVDFIQAARNGGTVAQFANTGTTDQALVMLPLLQPDLTVVNLTINDSNGGTPLADYQTDLEAIVDAAKQSGDVLLMVGPPSDTTQATDGTLDTYIAVLKRVAINKGTAVLDLKSNSLWGPYADHPSYYNDTLHPNATGYGIIASILNSVLAAADPPAGTIPLAALGSPAFYGNPTAPTQAASDNDTSIATTEFVKLVAPPGPNLLYNPEMRFDQRNEGTTVSPSGSNTYCLDMWIISGTLSGGQTVTCQRTADGPVGDPYSALITVTAAAATPAGDTLNLLQPLTTGVIASLGYGATTGQTTYLSFYIKSSLTGVFAVNLNNAANNRIFVGTCTILTAATWTSCGISIPPDTTGTWTATGEGRAGHLRFTLVAGSSHNTATAGAWNAIVAQIGTVDQVELTETNGATFQISKLKWEVGGSPTPFVSRPYPVELAALQHFYIKSFPQGVKPAQNAGLAGAFCLPAPSATAGTFGYHWRYPVEMWTTPTVTTYNPSAANANWRDVTAGADANATKDPAGAAGTTGMTINEVTTALTAGNNYCIHATAAAQL